ncbi:MAG: rod shape-determining protein MreD [Endomicrobium sp.]|nr:rod shape-determining protein MreD [Endomicrobium sp.]
MKNLIYYIIFYIVFCLLQFSFSKYINFFGKFPNFILIFIVYIGLSKGSMFAQLMGFLFGLTWDVFSTDFFGIRTIMFTIIGYFSGKLNKNFDGDKILTQYVVVFLASVVYKLGTNLICYVILSNKDYNFLILDSSLKIFITVLIAPVIFYILNYVKKEI